MMRPFTIAPAEPGDLAEAAALFREYAAELDVDLSFQSFEQELADCPAHTRRRRARCCWRAERTVLPSGASLCGRSMGARAR